jgi:flagellar motor switch protein FliN/FliY
MSEIFAKMVDISPPNIKVVEKEDKNQLNIVEGTSVSISFDLEIGGTIKSKLKQVISFENAKKMANELMNDVKGESIQIQNELTIDEEELLTQTEKDVIGELANISFGAAATSLSTILSHKVSITTPNIEIVSVKRG